MNKSANEYTMQDQSTKPYAWTIEGADAQEISKMGASEYVKSYVMNIIPVSAEFQGIDPDVTVEEIYAALEENGEISEMVEYVKAWVFENTFLFDVEDYETTPESTPAPRPRPVVADKFPTFQIEHDGESVEYAGVQIRCYRYALWIDGGENDDYLFATITNAQEDAIDSGNTVITVEVIPAIQRSIDFWLANQPE